LAFSSHLAYRQRHHPLTSERRAWRADQPAHDIIIIIIIIGIIIIIVIIIIIIIIIMSPYEFRVWIYRISASTSVSFRV
jgi:hypothetical protein